MFHRVPGFRLGVDAARDPFDPQPDLEGQHHVFIYLTGRGMVSYLFARATEGEIVAEAERTIPMGSTQIWVLRWLRAIQRQPRARVRPSQRRAAARLRPDGFQEGRSYLLIGENARCFGGADTPASATDAARALADAEGVRIAIGLLTANITWH
ncbi:MAG TPA: hypothetical protein VGU22_01200 [Methylomirabilota bacterium]|jgi:hypothetical protein|nr:hypothetical protein [Methylomirabilota bacterium]